MKVWNHMKAHWELWLTVIIPAAIGSVMWVAQVQGYDGRITKNEATIQENQEQQAKQGKTIERIDGNLVYLMRALHVKPLNLIEDGNTE